MCKKFPSCLRIYVVIFCLFLCIRGRSVFAASDVSTALSTQTSEAVGSSDEESIRLAQLRRLNAVDTISCGYSHTVSLHTDGTVTAVGDNKFEQCEVEDWTDVVAVSAGGQHTVGLLSNGTVLAVGNNEYGQCNLSDWTDIVAVSAGSFHTVGVHSDGTVVAAGYDAFGQCGVSGWTDIVAVAAGWGHTAGLHSDGTVVAVGMDGNGQCDVNAWTDIVAICAGNNHTVGLRFDGTVVAVGVNEHGECSVDGWTGITAVAAGTNHTVGLCSDGTVVAVGQNDNGQCGVENWSYVAGISAGSGYTVGLWSDGTAAALGDNMFQQCDLDDWIGIEVMTTENLQPVGNLAGAGDTLAMYAELVAQYEEKYGVAYAWDQFQFRIMTGLCFTRLLDFDQNGTEELLMVYNAETEILINSIGEFVWEVWSCDSGEPVMLATNELYMTNGGVQRLLLDQHDGKWYVRRGGADAAEDNFYYGFGKEGFGLVREASTDFWEESIINGEAVSQDQWDMEEASWQENEESFRMNYLEEEEYEPLLVSCALTKSKLHMEPSGQAGIGNTDYVIADSSQQSLSNEMLRGMSAQDLLIARNEMYARHGLRFENEQLQQYFESKSWYHPQHSLEESLSLQDSILTGIEEENFAVIKAAEAALPSPKFDRLISKAVPVDDPESFFASLPDTFVFSSGAGAWGTTLQISSDGSFTGDYSDSDMGDVGEDYPNGKIYICDFWGKFTSLKKISDHIYSMELESLETGGTQGETYIEDGVLHIYSNPYGIGGGETFLIYLPGTKYSDMETGFISWLYMGTTMSELPYDECGIYNVYAKDGFVGHYD